MARARIYVYSIGFDSIGRDLESRLDLNGKEKCARDVNIYMLLIFLESIWEGGREGGEF